MLRLFWRASGVLDRIKSSAYSKYLISVCNNCRPGLSDWSSRSANSLIYMLNKSRAEAAALSHTSLLRKIVCPLLSNFRCTFILVIHVFN